VGIGDLVYGAYSKRLSSQIDQDRIPRHVGVVLDGNRRWASEHGNATDHGHRVGAAKIEEFIGWCDEVGVEVVTLWLLSTDNLARPTAELEPLLEIITNTVSELAATRRWRVHPVGALDLLPAQTSRALKEADVSTRDIGGITVNVAVGYGGRHELVDAVRALLLEQAELGTSLEDLAQVLEADHIAEHLYTKGQPDPDLLIRTSGEQRLSGFMLWQSANSEFYFCEAYWPDFRKVDFLRALRAYSQRDRRFGT
jgi:short-chain Z-isoprenyl diphosphate synthase